jgi:hypothetical protein
MLNVTIHQAGSGLCSLTNKEGDGITVSFEDGTVKNQFLTYRAFRQLLAMKLTPAKPEPEPKVPLALAINEPVAIAE